MFYITPIQWACGRLVLPLSLLVVAGAFVELRALGLEDLLAGRRGVPWIGMKIDRIRISLISYLFLYLYSNA